MFGKPQIDFTQIRPTSKLTLKLSCLAACGNNVEQAELVYNFIAGDMKDLPDFDVPPVSTFEQIKTGANNLFGWIGEHRDQLMEGWNFIQAMRGGNMIPVAPAVPPTDIPPIPAPK